MVTQTSLEAYIKQIESGQLKRDADRVLQYAIEQYRKYDTGFTCFFAESSLGMKHQTITGRLADLQDLGLIYVILRLKQDGQLVNMYKYEPDVRKAIARAKLRRLQKYKAWKKRGEKFADLIHTDDEIFENFKQRSR